MKSEISEQLKTHFPDLCPAEAEKANDEFIDYKVLHHLAAWCATNFTDGKVQNLLEIIGAMYKRDNLYVNNAIENEFLSVLSRSAVSHELTAQLVTMPESLRSAYIKTLLENHKS